MQTYRDKRVVLIWVDRVLQLPFMIESEAKTELS